MPTKRAQKNLLLIYSTTQLILSGVKLLLDKRTLDKNNFLPNLGSHLINRTIEGIVEILKQQANYKDVKIRLTKLPIDVALEFDCLRLQQVTINLLSNALKFTRSHDTIDVRIILQELGDSG